MGDVDGCRVHPHKPVRCVELCSACYQRVEKAHSRWLDTEAPTKTQAQTLAHMGRPTAKMLERWPALPQLVEAARELAPPAPRVVAPQPAPAAIEAEVVELPRRHAAADLADLVADLRGRTELGELALDLRRKEYREALLVRLCEQVCHGIEGDAGALALVTAAEEMNSALLSLSERLELELVRQVADEGAIGG